ncbi:MAG: alkyl hydroperoxide reductase/Thiol specific antioxidant/Mal allergen [Myxococcales bacterium]|nr:alkyl hydroperoxide reductase/Thiol specific antioxidant/Mal allergen [Myxococcales bacterium]
MADGTKPAANDRGVVINPRVLLVGGGAALVGLAMLVAFLWMVPSAAAREEKAACRGLLGDQPLNPAVCNGQPCIVPAHAPDFTALDHQGKPVRLSDFQGKVVLVNFWASWCGVCKTEKPALLAMANELARDDFAVIALASDHNWSDVLLALIDSLAPGAAVPKADKSGSVPLPQALDAYRMALPTGVPFKVFIDPPAGDGNIGQIAASWGIKAVPETALIDRKGNIRAYFVNKRDWTSNVAQTCIRSVLDE